MKGPVDYGHKGDGRGDSRGHYNNGQSHHYHPGEPQQGSGDGNEFAEFLWMAEENLEEFDRQCELEFWEEQFIESCFEEMWQEEQRLPNGVHIPTQQNVASVVPRNGPPMVNPAIPGAGPSANNNPRGSWGHPGSQYRQNGREGAELAGLMQGLNIEEHNQKNTVMSSTLNPNAPEFVPRGAADIRGSADR